VPLSISISKTFEFMLSDIVVGVFSKWIGPSVDLLKTLNSLSSDVVLGLIWFIWGQVVLGTGSSVGSTIVVPLEVSVGQAFQLLLSNVFVSVLSEWVSIIRRLSKGRVVSLNINSLDISKECGNSKGDFHYFYSILII